MFDGDDGFVSGGVGIIGVSSCTEKSRMILLLVFVFVFIPVLMWLTCTFTLDVVISVISSGLLDVVV